MGRGHIVAASHTACYLPRMIMITRSPFSALTLLVGKGIRPVKKLDVGLLVVTF